MRTLPSIALALLLGATAAGQKAPAQAGHVAPVSTISAERLARIDKVLQEYVDENRVAGGSAGAQDGKAVYERAVGGPTRKPAQWRRTRSSASCG
jgi:hypothetical protein